MRQLHLKPLLFSFPFSRFRPISVFREADEDESGFMCCAFSARERFLMLGTCTGQLKLYNVFTGQEEASYNCHTSAITHLEPSRVSRSCILTPKLCNSKTRFSFNSIEEMQQISLYNKMEEQILKKYLRKFFLFFNCVSFNQHVTFDLKTL